LRFSLFVPFFYAGKCDYKKVRCRFAIILLYCTLFQSCHKYFGMSRTIILEKVLSVNIERTLIALQDKELLHNRSIAMNSISIVAIFNLGKISQTFFFSFFFCHFITFQCQAILSCAPFAQHSQE